MSRNEGGKRKGGNDSDKGKLINEIDTISKAIYPERNPIRSSASSSSSTAVVQGKSIGRPGRSDSLTNPKPWGIGGGVSGENQAKDKKSFWNKWKPLKAISQARSRKFNCHFTLQVHTVEGLPSVFSGSGLSVHWKRRDGVLLVAGPVKVVEGVAEFEEQLTHTCSVHAHRSGLNHSVKYEAKLWSLYASVDGKLDGEAKPDLGKHIVDLTRILPLTFEELDDEKNMRKWTTTYKLQGMAAGAIMNVSFGYLVLGDNPFLPPNNKIVLERLGSKQHNAAAGRSLVRVSNDDGSTMVVRGSVSLPKDKRPVAVNRSVEDIKVLHEVFPVRKNDLSESLNVLDQMFQVEKSDSSDIGGSGVDVSVDHSDPSELSLQRTDSFKENVVCGNNDSSSVEKGLENYMEETTTCSGKINTVTDHHAEVQSHDISANCGNIEASVEGDPVIELKRADNKVEESKESVLEDLDNALNDVVGLETSEEKSESGDSENNGDGMSNIVVEMPDSSEGLDCDENEFLNLIGVKEDPLAALICEDDPESPRERLLREFERETEASGYSLFGFDFGEEDEEEYEEYNAPRVPEWEYLDENFELPIPSTTEISEEYYSAHQAGTSRDFTVPRWGNFADDSILPPDVEDHESVSQSAGWRPKAKVLEDLETEALMQELGLNAEAFQSSPPHQSAASASPSELTHEDSSTLPALGDGLGPLLQTKNGGFLRSMNPTHFRDSKSGGSLIMQVSSPVVVPAEMGSGIMEMLENLASLGMERLSMQANKLMPLEDITGNMMQQIAWEAVPQLETNERQDVLQHVSDLAPVPSGGHRKNKSRPSKSGSRTSSSSVRKGDLDSEYVSLEDLAPLAVDKIEALSIEGLRIQSGMSEEEAPSSIRPKSLGAEGAVGLQLLDVRDNSDDVDGLMAMSLTLDEWMRLDSGEIDEDEMKNERTSKILSAHHASSTDLTSPLVSASSSSGGAYQQRTSSEFSWNYISGAGDDEETWARGLTPTLFWKNAYDLISVGPDLCNQKVAEIVEKHRVYRAQRGENAPQITVKSSQPRESNSHPSLDKEELLLPPEFSHLSIQGNSSTEDCLMYWLGSSNIAVGSTQVATTEPQVDCILNCDKELISVGTSYAYLHLPTMNSKFDRFSLLSNLPSSIEFAKKNLIQGKTLLVCCGDGEDISICFCLAILISLFDEDGTFNDQRSPSEMQITKLEMRRRLVYVCKYATSARPSRGNLKQVFSFLNGGRVPV